MAGPPPAHTPLGLQQNIPAAAQQPMQTSPTLVPQVQEEEPVKMMEVQSDPEPQAEDAWAEDKVPMEIVEQPIMQDEIQAQEPVISNEPKTYATLVKSGGSSAGTFASAAMSTSPNQVSKPASSPPPMNRLENRDQIIMGGPAAAPPLGQRNNLQRGPRQGANTGPRNMPRQDSRGGPNRTSFNDDNEERRRSQTGGLGSGGGNNAAQYSDNHQLFLGNLPHSATEEDLRELFGAFGTIVELRIHSKPGTKNVPGTRVPPNYGFITYEDQHSVQNCLAAKPLYFPPNCENGQKLNVEEKKARPRQSMDGGRVNSSGGPDGLGLGRPNSGLGPRSGGPGNMMRGGPGGMAHRGPPRGGGNFQRGGGGGGENRGQNMNRGGGGGNNSYNNRR